MFIREQKTNPAVVLLPDFSDRDDMAERGKESSLCHETLPLADEVLHPSPIFFEALSNAERGNLTNERQRQRRIERKLN